MEWQQIEYFRVVARLQHITNAAAVLSISQPALSRSMSKLEQELGVPLFERQGRTIKLNHYGELFLERADRIIKEYQEGKQEIQDLLDPNYGEISLGFMPTLGTYLIPHLIRSFQKEYPNIKFRFKQNGNDSLLNQLEAGEIDLCLVSFIQGHKEIQWTELWKEELFLIVPFDHHLAHRESVTLQEIADETFVLLEKGNGLRGITDRLFDESGISPEITFEGEEVHTVVAFVAAGLGVTLIPEFKGIDWTKLSRIRVRAANCHRMIGLASVKGRYTSPAAKRFQQFVKEYFKN